MKLALVVLTLVVAAAAAVAVNLVLLGSASGSNDPVGNLRPIANMPASPPAPNAELFAEAAALVPADVAPVFRDFLTRPDLDEVAEEMGYAAGRDRDGFRYLRKCGGGRIDDDEG